MIRNTYIGLTHDGRYNNYNGFPEINNAFESAAQLFSERLDDLPARPSLGKPGGVFICSQVFPGVSPKAGYGLNAGCIPFQFRPMLT